MDRTQDKGREKHEMNGAGRPARPLWLRGLQRALVLAAVWWVVSDGDASSWIMGVPAIVLGVFVALVLPPPGQIQWRAGALLRFIPIFVKASLRGGADVALRAVHPRLPLHPGLVLYPLRIRQRPAQIFLVNTISLLPGTLSLELSEDGVILQALDTRLPIVEEIREMEVLVASIFGIALQQADS